MASSSFQRQIDEAKCDGNKSRELIAVKQRRGSDCGLASLATVAQYYGRSVDYDDIFCAIALDGQGTNFLNISKIAELLGFSTQGFRGSYDAISSCTLPAIAHIRRILAGGHFVVVHCWNSSSVMVADPAVGTRMVSRRAFCRCWTGHLLTVVPARTP